MVEHIVGTDIEDFLTAVRILADANLLSFIGGTLQDKSDDQWATYPIPDDTGRAGVSCFSKSFWAFVTSHQLGVQEMETLLKLGSSPGDTVSIELPLVNPKQL